MAVRDDLDTILRLIERVESTVRGKTAASFNSSSDAVDAVAYRLAMIGEHCQRLPERLRERHPHLAWRAMVGLRNIVAHAYDIIDADIVWRTATQDLDPVRKMATTEIRCLEDPSA